MKTRHLILIGLTILLWFSFRFLLPLTLPFVLAYFFAKLVSPMIQFLVNKLKWRRKVSIFLVVFFTLLILGGFSVYIITLIISQGMMLLQKIPVYGQICGRMLEKMCSHCDRMLELADGSSFDYLEGQAAGLYQKIGTDLLPKLSGCAIFLVKKGIGAISSLFIFFLSVLLILLDDKMPAVRGRLRPFVQKLRGAGLAYLKAQSLLLFIIAALLALGFYFMGNDYAILLAIGIALLDAFPVLGSGMVLIPWAVLSVIGGRYYDAAIVTTLFCVVTFLREILEPRLIGKEVGIKPLYLIISVYAGIELFGIGGVILGPVSLTILKAVREELIKRERT